MAGNGRLDEEVGDKAGMGEGEACDGGGGVEGEPLLHGLPLVSVPVCGYHRILHHHLQ